MIICLSGRHRNINLIFLGGPESISYINMGLIECTLYRSCSFLGFSSAVYSDCHCIKMLF